MPQKLPQNDKQRSVRGGEIKKETQSSQAQQKGLGAARQIDSCAITGKFELQSTSTGSRDATWRSVDPVTIEEWCKSMQLQRAGQVESGCSCCPDWRDQAVHSSRKMGN
ncbi:hypothetical protein H101_07669 [Trichophyton interdigitale H6]|nr:hypothetical protein H101_07669 [Trichophyton interdigitale H6]